MAQLGRVLGFVIAGLTSATVGFADWQYTRWGMTTEEVSTAARTDGASTTEPTAKERAEDNPGITTQSPARLELKSAVTSGRYAFTVYFFFDNGRLAKVQLWHQSSDPGTEAGLLGSLRDKYGPPEEFDGTSYGTTAKWRTDTDRITYMSLITGAYTIVYEPRQTADSDKL
jgi:hypothetical protein